GGAGVSGARDRDDGGPGAGGIRREEFESPPDPATVRRLGRRALALGVAKAFDFAVQFLLPVVLVRFLDADAFGQYRLLWLAVGTVMAVATLDLPASLYYFLPRSDPAARRLYISQ